MYRTAIEPWLLCTATHLLAKLCVISRWVYVTNIFYKTFEHFEERKSPKIYIWIRLNLLKISCSQSDDLPLSSTALPLCFPAGVLLYHLALFLYCWAQQGWRSSQHKRALVSTATAWHSLDRQGRRSDAFVSEEERYTETKIYIVSGQNRIPITSRIIKHPEKSTKPPIRSSWESASEENNKAAFIRAI